MISAEKANNGSVLLGLYDNRVRRGSPEMRAEWPSLRCRAVARMFSGGVGKVYVRDDVKRALTVGDLRNVKSPLERLTESGGDMWWDAGAVILSGEFGMNYRFA